MAATRAAVLASHCREAAPTAAAAAAAGNAVLDGVRVVELATVVAAPSATAVMADFGADVIKVEAPEGDYFRNEAKQLTPHRPHGALFDNVNRGKRSIVLDLKKAEAQASLRKLLATADVFVTNVRPDALRRLGLDYETLHAALPRLVYAHLTAWGLEGANKDKPGYDAGAFFAATGVQDLLRPNETSEPPRYPGGFGDLATSLQLVSGIALALFHRERRGEGQLVDASLFRAGVWMLGLPMTMIQVPKRGPLTARTVRGGRQGGFNPIFNTYKTKDGRWVQLLGLEMARHLWKTLDTMGLKNLREDARFSSVKSCLKNKTQLMKLLEARFAERTLAEWSRDFDAADVWYVTTQRYEDVAKDPMGSHAFVDVPGLEHKLIASPVRLSAGAPQPKGPAPALGQHTDEVLRSLQ